jgi:hypothetical protein
MLYLLIALQLADIATTHYALRTGIGQEANPLLRKLFDKFGHEVVLLVTKGAFIVFLWFAHPYILTEVLYLVAAGYVWVIWNNLSVISKGRK